MLTLGRKLINPYQVIGDFCSIRELTSHRQKLDRFFHSAFGYKSQEVIDYPFDITYTYDGLIYWLEALFRLRKSGNYPYRIRTYREQAIVKMVVHIRKFSQAEYEPSFYSHTPVHLTFRELHQPYVVLFDILDWRDFAHWKKRLFQWQVNALSGVEDIGSPMEEDDLEMYRCLHRLIEVSFLIFTVELDSKELEVIDQL
ncbi:hypothetical protein IFO69_00020 [Echinicola sp. CAU 1574]|uniref:Uncharacterized protein n=1 Tax=Echinicola arenosa TaxID=2774144 RepID=A0ABR9AEM5_9BACT|nr:hypothetical protein [Echinicola arenosa]MBD8487118.1 hypothetical protein [Echinicola arenosa]